jgi:hypothetical protein
LRGGHAHRRSCRTCTRRNAHRRSCQARTNNRQVSSPKETPDGHAHRRSCMVSSARRTLGEGVASTHATSTLHAHRRSCRAGTLTPQSSPKELQGGVAWTRTRHKAHRRSCKARTKKGGGQHETLTRRRRSKHQRRHNQSCRRQPAVPAHFFPLFFPIAGYGRSCKFASIAGSGRPSKICVGSPTGPQRHLLCGQLGWPRPIKMNRA